MVLYTEEETQKERDDGGKVWYGGGLAVVAVMERYFTTGRHRAYYKAELRRMERKSHNIFLSFSLSFSPQSSFCCYFHQSLSTVSLFLSVLDDIPCWLLSSPLFSCALSLLIDNVIVSIRFRISAVRHNMQSNLSLPSIESDTTRKSKQCAISRRLSISCKTTVNGSPINQKYDGVWL
ncbi:hypothetical protein BJ165DRAFT_1517090 [Panaeolus papilionaceus]|nr:hypothetical protein BJ165DRAFT_1517090 [Panaeolus papilionaceus]